MELDISWEEKSVGEQEQKELTELFKAGITEALKAAGGPEDAEIGLVLVDDETIQLLNRNYRGIDRPTDVLSFALQEKGEDEPDIFFDSDCYELVEYEEDSQDEGDAPGRDEDENRDYSVELIMEEEYGTEDGEPDEDETIEFMIEDDFLYEDSVLGDIVISVERARAQAEEYGHSFAREIVYLAVHGTLHLLGYDHGTDEKCSIMRRLEEQVMEKIGLPR